MKSLHFSSEYIPFERPPLLSENLPHNPYQLLHEVFFPESTPGSFKLPLIQWLNILNQNRLNSNSNDGSSATIDEFYNSLISLIDALNQIEDSKGVISSLGLTTIGQAENIENANAIIRQFCHRYPQIYTRRELWCFMHAVIENASELPPQSEPITVIDWYEQVSALTDAAYLLQIQ